MRKDDSLHKMNDFSENYQNCASFFSSVTWYGVELKGTVHIFLDYIHKYFTLNGILLLAWLLSRCKQSSKIMSGK